MAEPDPTAAAPSFAQIAHDFGLWNAAGAMGALIIIWKSGEIIRAVGDVVKGWRETSLAIRQFDQRRGPRVEAIGDDVRHERERLHIGDGA